MSIRTDIQGLGPVLYWPLEDSTAPAAADDSGHGHTGIYGGVFTLRQYGPEPGTFAAQFATGGSVTCTGMPQLASAPFSICWYSSRNVTASPAQGDEISLGLRSASRGVFVAVTNANLAQVFAYSTGGTQQQSTTFAVPIWNKWWHAYTLTFTPTTSWVLWIDGASVISLPQSINTILSTDTFGFTAPYAAVAAHIAYYDKVLTPANIAAIHSHRFDWPFGPMLNVTWPSPPSGGGSAALIPTDPVVVDINADLTNVLRAVRRTYP